jgi:hypothetical protein
MANLAEGLVEELKRNRELLKCYEQIGPEGMFGASMIALDIKKAEEAIMNGDTIAMLVIFETLKNNE